jgi:hypothetical protein
MLQFLTRYDLTRMPQEQRENLKGLVLEGHVPPTLSQFVTGEIRFEHAETKLSRRRPAGFHRNHPICRGL